MSLSLRAATKPRPKRFADRLLAIDPSTHRFHDRRIGELPDLLRPKDLLVVNDAATLPASLRARGPCDEPIEVRLASHEDGATWRAVLFGAGDWRTPTEHRPLPPVLAPGETLLFEGGLRARIASVSRISPRLIDLEFSEDGAEFWRALYAVGRPVQYAYLAADIALDRVQVGYSARPWAAEMPSAGRPLSWSLLLDVRRRGVLIRSLTHAAGLSSTGDPALDRELPFAERFEIPEETARAVADTRSTGGRIIAAGTTVVRALEGAALASEKSGAITAREGVTDLRIDATYVPRIVDGVLSGIHGPDQSHFSLLEAFCPRALLESAYAHAVDTGYLGHEFGDSCLII